jgi:transcriptional regulator with XRE-family HTH domain
MSGPAVIGPGERGPRPRPLLRTTLGEILRRTRLEQRRTLADVARAARVSMPYLSELERGRKEASSEVLAAVCDALRIELSDLLAVAGRDLVGHRARRGQVVRLAAIRGERVMPETAASPEAATPPDAVAPDAATTRPVDAVAPEAAPALPEASVQPQASVTAQVGVLPQAGGRPQGRGPGDVVCLLAA